ncbi:MAG TPA: molecular chaperone DnaJ [Gammaproteobacteria bacterium]|nr:molecular chaperone DnaJ [Gammaproteobacteria bacterium]
MDFPASLFPPFMLWSANGLMSLVVLAALWRLPLARLWNNEFTHVYFAACVVLLLLWNTGVGVLPALNFHLLGMTVVTLMFGWRYAVLAALIVTAGTIVNQHGHWSAIGLNALVSGCVPVLVTELMLRLARRRLPHNFFVYVYVNGFLAAGLSTVLASLTGALLMLLADSTSAAWLSYQYFPYFPLLFFAEALINGLIMTGLVAMRPGWVASFDDALYLNGK